MHKFAIEVLGWYGMCAVLSAYMLVSFDILLPQHVVPLLLNLSGSLSLIVLSLYKKAYQPAFLNIIWAVISLVTIINVFA